MSRVMTVSKARSTVGLPFPVSAVSWTLLLVLLLSSSFSHIHRSGQQDTDEYTSGRNELALNARDGGPRSRSFEFHDSIDKGPGYSGDYDSSLHLAEASRQDCLKTKSGFDLNDEGVLTDRSVLSQVVSPTPGIGTVDALLYAEYGAGLLQKSGAPEESLNGIRLSFLEGSHSTTVTDYKDFPGQECALPRSDEVFGENFCRPVDVVRELEPGETQLVCRKITLSGTTSCHLACSRIAQCFKTGIDSRFCPYDGSLFNLLRPPETHQNSVQYWLTFSESVINRKTSEKVNIRPSDRELSRIESLEAVDTLRTAIDLDSQKDTIGRESIDVVDEVTVRILPATKEFRDVADKDDVRPLSEVNLKEGTQNHRLEDNDPSTTKVTWDNIKGSRADEDKGMSGPSQRRLGIVNVNGVLTEQLQNILHPQGEGPLDDKPLTFAGMDNGVQLETVRPTRVGTVMSLDEYKRSNLEKQQKLDHDVNVNIVHSQKLRHSDESYNYADSSHGAKVLSSNKEAKGPSHIISSDKDKYLRNPCSAEDKYVVLELSEETFVDTVVIANFEFHSANLKDFEVFGSPLYPAKEWILLGRFRAENVRHRQKFSIEDPKLVRYLKLKMLTHWGSEFFCTLSAVEVYGVDVIKNLLDDWIAHKEGENVPRTQMNGLAIHHDETAPESLQALDARASDAASKVTPGSESSIELATGLVAGSPEVKEKKIVGSSRDEESKGVDTTLEVHYSVGGKTPGDSVLKILMQKVKGLESSQSLFYNYLEDMNIKYRAMLSELDKDLILTTERVRNEVAVSASLAMRLAELGVKRREERAYVEHKFALIAANLTENIEFMRWHVQTMERREITAVILALLCLILSGFLHLLARFVARRVSSKNYRLQTIGEDTDELVNSWSMSLICNRSSSVILYLASGLIILVLTV